MNWEVNIPTLLALAAVYARLVRMDERVRILWRRSGIEEAQEAKAE
jgi:hypothetical protein